MGVGILFVVVTPTICNLGVGRVLVDGGAGLNLLSLQVFHKMQVGERKLLPSMPFYGVTDGKMIPLGQVELPVTFKEWDNLWQNRMNYSGSSTQTIESQHTSNGTTHWSVGSTPDSTTVTQD
jgi:hypothetical protein